MRHAVVFLLIALLLVTAGPAHAEYLDGSELEADAPAHLRERVDALINDGVASFVSADGAPSLAASVAASRLELRHDRTIVCQDTDAACAADPLGSQGASETVTLTDATLRVTRVLGAYQLVITNDDAYADGGSFGTPGPIVATAGGRSALDATGEARSLSPYEQGWVTTEPKAFGETIYTIGPDQPVLDAAGGSLRAAGGFEVLLQGVEVEVKGTDADGAAFSQTYRTSVPAEDGVAEFIVVEAAVGAFSATSQSALHAFQVRAVDVKGGVDLTGATGTVRTEDGSQQHENAAITLAGPVELLVKVIPGGSPARFDLVLSSHLRVLEDANIPDEESEETSAGELVAAGVAGAGGAGVLAAAIFYWPRVRYGLTLLALPLYTRIQRTDVLEHGKRDEIYALIRESPGIHAHEIGAKAAIGWGTTVYHLKLLEQHNLIISKKSGRYKRFFVNTGEYTKTKEVFGALRNETARAVADFIARNPGTNQKELCAALGIQPSLASWHVQKLEQVQLVRRERDGRQVRYHTGDAWGQVSGALQGTEALGSTDAEADDAARA